MRPSWSTRMRSDIARTSGRSLEMRMIPSPEAASSEMIRCTSTLAPMSMPRVGSSRMRTVGFDASHLASTTFCWLPPERAATIWSTPVIFTLNCSVYSSATARSADARTRSRGKSRGRIGRVTFCGDREAQHEALLVPVLGQVGDPGVHRSRRAGEAHGRPPKPDLTGVALVDPEQDARNLGPAGPDQAREADDLAGPDREADVAERRLPGSGRRPRAAPRRSASRPSGTATRPDRPCAGRGPRWSVRSSGS